MIPENTVPGTKVLHQKFGILTVISISGNAVDVQFGECGSILSTYRKFLTLKEE